MSKQENVPESTPVSTLDDVRQQIDAIDRKIQTLLNERAEAALSVATIKLAEAAGEPVDFYRPEREAQILKLVAKRNEGPMDSLAVQRIFREIISASLALESPMRVAYLGPEGTFTHAAAARHFGHAVDTVPNSDIEEIFQSVQSGDVRFGVVPVENSIEGSVNQTLDQLTRTPLRVCGEVRMRIQHCLMSTASALDEVQQVHAHPQALAQCQRWLNTHLPAAKRVSASSNAAAANAVRSGDGAAAIAGETAAELYGLQLLATGIEDEKNNTTRFLIIGDQQIAPSGDDSTLLLIAAPHRPGGLREMLMPLEQAGVSMTRIESRPSRSGLWDYVFFIDVHGHELDQNLSEVLQKLRDLAPLLKVLGSYPRAL
ncbi:MAG: prephenate dehydratase [Granulosicoccus sp.]|nr:prephenate dehydratase [Granulosicoccus sp.]